MKIYKLIVRQIDYVLKTLSSSKNY